MCLNRDQPENVDKDEDYDDNNNMEDDCIFDNANHNVSNHDNHASNAYNYKIGKR